MAKFSGVRRVAASVANAVRLTERATLAYASDEMKLEMFPPGQAAMRIIPMAIDGGGLRSITSPKVSAGRSMNCALIPRKADFGFRRIFLNCSTLISSATPNIMQASVTFM
jgi:hypothetical protein